MPEIIKMILGANIFSKLDLKDAFNQVPVKREHQSFTAFKFPKGIFEYKVMPFGLRNAPAVFQRMINQVLGCLIGVCCVAYMDDILVFSRSKEQHTADVCKVLAALSKAWLHLKLSKCEFYKEEVSFLGNLVLKDGHSICLEKLKAIKEWGVPCTTTELRSFLGTINFLRRFCKDILATVAPLTELCGDANFSWGTDQQRAFNSIKSTLASSPVLAHSNFDAPFIVETEASNFAVGAVLLQADNEGTERPVCFFSRKMTKAKTDYPFMTKSFWLSWLH